MRAPNANGVTRSMDPGGRTVDRPDGAPHPHLRTRSGGRALGDTDPQMTALARSGAAR